MATLLIAGAVLCTTFAPAPTPVQDAYADSGRTMNVGTFVWDATNGYWVKTPGDSNFIYSRGIDYAHAKIHAGMRYSFANTVTLNSGNSRGYLINATNADYLAHFYHAVSASGAATVTFYRSPTVTNEGSAITFYNRRDGFAGEGQVAAFVSPTITDLGEWIESEGIGSHKSSGETSFDLEHILQRNTYYFINVVSAANGNVVTVQFDHYWD